MTMVRRRMILDILAADTVISSDVTASMCLNPTKDKELEQIGIISGALLNKPAHFHTAIGSWASWLCEMDTKVM